MRCYDIEKTQEAGLVAAKAAMPKSAQAGFNVVMGHDNRSVEAIKAVALPPQTEYKETA